MSYFDEAVRGLIKDEGRKVNPHDNGRGPSKYGVTLATYRELHPDAKEADIWALTEQQAIDFYRRWAWMPRGLGLIDDQAVANKLLDLGANIGPGLAVMFLQRAAGAKPADGVVGPVTAGKANAIAAAKLLEGIRTAGAQYYGELVRRRPELSRFLDGWLARLKR